MRDLVQILSLPWKLFSFFSCSVIAYHIVYAMWSSGNVFLKYLEYRLYYWKASCTKCCLRLDRKKTGSIMSLWKLLKIHPIFPLLKLKININNNKDWISGKWFSDRLSICPLFWRYYKKKWVAYLRKVQDSSKLSH
jgi:hypothetical protein